MFRVFDGPFHGDGERGAVAADRLTWCGCGARAIQSGTGAVQRGCLGSFGALKVTNTPRSWIRIDGVVPLREPRMARLRRGGARDTLRYPRPDLVSRGVHGRYF